MKLTLRDYLSNILFAFILFPLLLGGGTKAGTALGFVWFYGALYILFFGK